MVKRRWLFRERDDRDERDERDERDNSEVGYHKNLCGYNPLRDGAYWARRGLVPVPFFHFPMFWKNGTPPPPLSQGLSAKGRNDPSTTRKLSLL